MNDFLSEIKISDVDVNVTVVTKQGLICDCFCRENILSNTGFLFFICSSCVSCVKQQIRRRKITKYYLMGFNSNGRENLISFKKFLMQNRLSEQLQLL